MTTFSFQKALSRPFNALCSQLMRGTSRKKTAFFPSALNRLGYSSRRLGLVGFHGKILGAQMSCGPWYFGCGISSPKIPIRISWPGKFTKRFGKPPPKSWGNEVGIQRRIKSPHVLNFQVTIAHYWLDDARPCRKIYLENGCRPKRGLTIRQRMRVLDEHGTKHCSGADGHS